jgi:hypothetical protein
MSHLVRSALNRVGQGLSLAWKGDVIPNRIQPVLRKLFLNNEDGNFTSPGGLSCCRNMPFVPGCVRRRERTAELQLRRRPGRNRSSRA